MINTLHEINPYTLTPYNCYLVLMTLVATIFENDGSIPYFVIGALNQPPTLSLRLVSKVIAGGSNPAGT